MVGKKKKIKITDRGDSSLNSQCEFEQILTLSYHKLSDHFIDSNKHNP